MAYRITYRTVHRFVAVPCAAVAATALIGACSSSGNGTPVVPAGGGSSSSSAAGGSSSSGDTGASGVSTDAIVAKLKDDPTINSVFKSTKASSKILNTAYTCMATAMQKDIDPGDVQAYVSGDKSIQSLKPITSTQNITKDISTCAKNALLH